MVEMAITSLVYMGVALMCIGAALVLGVLAKISASQRGAVGLFVLAIIFLCALSAMLLWFGMAGMS